jgi:hypothetical protein
VCTVIDNVVFSVIFGSVGKVVHLSARVVASPYLVVGRILEELLAALANLLCDGFAHLRTEIGQWINEQW